MDAYIIRVFVNGLVYLRDLLSRWLDAAEAC